MVAGWAQQNSASLQSSPRRGTHEPGPVFQVSNIHRGFGQWPRAVRALKRNVWQIEGMPMRSQYTVSSGHGSGMSEPLLQSQYSWPITIQQKSLYFIRISHHSRSLHSQSQHLIGHTKMYSQTLAQEPHYWGTPGGCKKCSIRGGQHVTSPLWGLFWYFDKE